MNLRLLCIGTLAMAAVSGSADGIDLKLTRIVSAGSGGDQWKRVEAPAQWDPAGTALVICDMWNTHSCTGAAARVKEMAPRANEFISALRARGVLIIHCPSETLKFYEGTPARKLAQSAPKAAYRFPSTGWCVLDPKREAPLPIDDSDGGCDDSPQCPSGTPWTRQIETLCPGPTLRHSPDGAPGPERRPGARPDRQHV
jgi:hypothetical protein